MPQVGGPRAAAGARARGAWQPQGLRGRGVARARAVGGRQQQERGCARRSGGMEQRARHLTTPPHTRRRPKCARTPRPPPAEVPRGNSSNCTYYTASVHGALADMRVTSDLPLYVSADWAAADESLAADALAGLKRAGYRVFRSPQEAGVAVEAGAAGDYELALRAERFVGSGRDPFSALALAERRRARRWAGLYAGFAAPPLRRAAPLLDAPWVFTLNSWSLAQEVYVRAAVASAEAQGGVVPHCVFAGDESAPVAQWLRSRGVQVLPYQPTWAERLKRAARAGGGAGATAGGGGSKARLGGDALVGTFQRIDIPIVPGLEQYGHVLYTDTDVFFRRPFDWSELPHPPPAAVGLGPEAANRYPFSVGVMVLHLPALRASHERFVEYALSHNLAQRKGGIQVRALQGRARPRPRWLPTCASARASPVMNPGRRRAAARPREGPARRAACTSAQRCQNGLSPH